MSRKPSIFALYRGDRFIDVGTIPEMAVRQHVKEKTLHFYATRIHRNRVSERGLIVVRLEEDDDN